jgi:hypothetical protein
MVLAISAYFLQPFGAGTERQWMGVAAGLLLGGGIIVFEIRLEQISLKRLIGATVGGARGAPDNAAAVLAERRDGVWGSAIAHAIDVGCSVFGI